ncbi:unnamed protein product [Lampetra planeri]
MLLKNTLQAGKHGVGGRAAVQAPSQGAYSHIESEKPMKRWITEVSEDRSEDKKDEDDVDLGADSDSTESITARERTDVQIYCVSPMPAPTFQTVTLTLFFTPDNDINKTKVLLFDKSKDENGQMLEHKTKVTLADEFHGSGIYAKIHDVRLEDTGLYVCESDGLFSNNVIRSVTHLNVEPEVRVGNPMEWMPRATAMADMVAADDGALETLAQGTEEPALLMANHHIVKDWRVSGEYGTKKMAPKKREMLGHVGGGGDVCGLEGDVSRPYPEDPSLDTPETRSIQLHLELDDLPPMWPYGPHHPWVPYRCCSTRAAFAPTAVPHPYIQPAAGGGEVQTGIMEEETDPVYEEVMPWLDDSAGC